MPAASASRFIEHGIFDDAQIHYGNPDVVFPMLKQLRSQLLRINLQWGGPNAVAKRRPGASDRSRTIPPTTGRMYDRTVQLRPAVRLKVVFAIIGTPPWANRNKGLNVAPTNPIDLQRFAAAAATRYSGTYEAPDGGSCRLCSAGSRGTIQGQGLRRPMKRHGFKGLPASHGAHRVHRAPGSIGACATPSRVFRGTKMAGRMGGERVTTQNLAGRQGRRRGRRRARPGLGPRPRRRRGADPQRHQARRRRAGSDEGST